MALITAPRAAQSGGSRAHERRHRAAAVDIEIGAALGAPLHIRSVAFGADTALSASRVPSDARCSWTDVGDPRAPRAVLYAVCVRPVRRACRSPARGASSRIRQRQQQWMCGL